MSANKSMQRFRVELEKSMFQEKQPDFFGIKPGLRHEEKVQLKVQSIRDRLFKRDQQSYIQKSELDQFFSSKENLQTLESLQQQQVVGKGQEKESHVKQRQISILQPNEFFQEKVNENNQMDTKIVVRDVIISPSKKESNVSNQIDVSKKTQIFEPIEISNTKIQKLETLLPQQFTCKKKEANDPIITQHLIQVEQKINNSNMTKRTSYLKFEDQKGKQTSQNEMDITQIVEEPDLQLKINTDLEIKKEDVFDQLTSVETPQSLLNSMGSLDNKILIQESKPKYRLKLDIESLFGKSNNQKPSQVKPSHNRDLSSKEFENISYIHCADLCGAESFQKSVSQIFSSEHSHQPSQVRNILNTSSPDKQKEIENITSRVLSKCLPSGKKSNEEEKRKITENDVQNESFIQQALENQSIKQIQNLDQVVNNKLKNESMCQNFTNNLNQNLNKEEILMPEIKICVPNLTFNNIDTQRSVIEQTVTSSRIIPSSMKLKNLNLKTDKQKRVMDLTLRKLFFRLDIKLKLSKLEFIFNLKQCKQRSSKI